MNVILFPKTNNNIKGNYYLQEKNNTIVVCIIVFIWSTKQKKIRYDVNIYLHPACGDPPRAALNDGPCALDGATSPARNALLPRQPAAVTAAASPSQKSTNSDETHLKSDLEPLRFDPRFVCPQI